MTSLCHIYGVVVCATLFCPTLIMTPAPSFFLVRYPVVVELCTPFLIIIA